MKKMRFVIIVILIGIILVSCGKKETRYTSDGKLVIKFWHSMSGALGTTLQKMIDQFNQMHKEVYIQPEFMGSYQALSQKILASIIANNQPVMAQAYEAWISKLITGNAVEPLDKYINSDPDFKKYFYNDILPVFVKNSIYNGKVMSLPFNKSLPVLYYNKDMFKEVGLDPNHPPATWEEFFEYAHKLTRDIDNDGKIDIYGNAFPITAWEWECFLYQAGGRILDEKGKAVFNKTGSKEALNYLIKRLTEKIAYRTSGYDHQNDFIAGKVAMIFGSSVSRSFMMMKKFNFKWGVAPMPAYKTSISLIAGTNGIIFSKNTIEQKKWAWEFLKWFSETKQTAYWAAHTGYLPISKSSLKERVLRNDLDQFPGVYKVVKSLKNADFEPRSAEWLICRDYLSNALEEAVIHASSRKKYNPQKILDKAAEKSNRWLVIE